MAFIPLPGGAKVCFHWTLAGELIEVCLVIKKGSGNMSQVDLQALADAAANWWGVDGKGNFPTSVLFTGSSATGLDSATAGEATHIESTPVAGTVNADALPGNCPLVSSWRTAKRGRSFRGRSYWPPFDVGARNGVNTINTSVITPWLADLASLQSALEGSVTGGDHVVMSRIADGVERETAVATSITSVIVDNNIDSQRRRLAGRGI